jgi:hypothetical protein
MNQQPDKLFRDKLAEQQKTVRGEAWNRIEAQLDKKNNKGLWLKIAASLLLLCVLGYLLWPSTTAIHPPIAETQPAKKEAETKAPAAAPSAPAAEQPEPADTRQQPVAQAKSRSESARKKNTIPQTNTASTLKHYNAHSHTVAEATTIIPDSEIVAQVLPSLDPATVQPVQTVSAQAEKNVTLVFTAKEAEEYLDKKALAEATSKDQKPSTLKKLLKKASDLKNNQDPMGELRQMKNEILALNFKSKQREQKNN